MFYSTYGSNSGQIGSPELKKTALLRQAASKSRNSARSLYHTEIELHVRYYAESHEAASQPAGLPNSWLDFKERPV